MIAAIAAVVSYFSGPMLNFGDFSRYARSFKAVRKGNWLGLPLNFLFFSILTVVTASATVPVFGEMITDPIQTVQRIDSAFAILLGGLTFVIATVGINIVANFISPAFDFSNVNPKKISWRMGGMIAAVGSVLLTPWNWYNSDEGILFTLGILGALIGPLFGILISGYYVVSKQRVWVDDMYSMDTTKRYWFRNGYNPNAVASVLIGGVPAIVLVLVGGRGLGRARAPRSSPTPATSAGSSAAASASSPSRSSSGPTRASRTSTATSRWPRPGSASERRRAYRRRIAVINPNTTESMTASIAEAARGVVDASTEVVAITNAHGPGLDREPLRRGVGRARPAGRDRGGGGGRGRRLRHRLLRRPGPGRRARDRRPARWSGSPRRAFHAGDACSAARSAWSRRWPARWARPSTSCSATASPATAAASTPARSRSSSWTTRPRTPARSSSTLPARGRARRGRLRGARLRGMADFCHDVSEQVGVPVIDGVSAGVLLVESMVKLGLRTSTRSEYAPPLPKEYR